MARRGHRRRKAPPASSSPVETNKTQVSNTQKTNLAHSRQHAESFRATKKSYADITRGKNEAAEKVPAKRSKDVHQVLETPSIRCGKKFAQESGADSSKTVTKADHMLVRDVVPDSTSTHIKSTLTGDNMENSQEEERKSSIEPASSRKVSRQPIHKDKITASPTGNPPTPCVQNSLRIQERHKMTVNGAQGSSDKNYTNRRQAASDQHAASVRHKNPKQCWTNRNKNQAETPKYTLLRHSDKVKRDKSVAGGRGGADERSAVVAADVEGKSKGVCNGLSTSNGGDIGKTGVEDPLIKDENRNAPEEISQSSSAGTSNQTQPALRNVNDPAAGEGRSRSSAPAGQLPEVFWSSIIPHEERYVHNESTNDWYRIDGAQRQKGSSPFQWSRDYRPRGRRNRARYRDCVPEGFRKCGISFSVQEQFPLHEELQNHVQVPLQYPGTPSPTPVPQCWSQCPCQPVMPPPGWVYTQSSWPMPLPLPPPPQPYVTYAQMPQSQHASVPFPSPVPWANQPGLPNVSFQQYPYM